MSNTYYGSKDVGFFILGGYSILGSQTAIVVDGEALTTETTPLGVAFPTHDLLGKYSATVTQQGFYDGTAGGANTAICDREGAEQVMLLAHQGNVAGREMVAWQGAFAGKYQRVIADKDLDRANATYTISGAKEYPIILKALAAVTSDADTEADSIDNTASSAAGGSGYFACTALTLDGGTNIAAKVRHSADDSTFADLISFTAATAVTAERKTVTGTVNRYLAASWAWTGGGASKSATIVVGFKRA